MKIQLKKLLDEKHMSRYRLSRITGIRYAALNKIYNNETTSIYLSSIESICRALNCTPNDLFVFDNENICSDSSDILSHDESNKKDT